MIKRETIMNHRRVVNKLDYRPTAETVRMLCDGALELLDALDGGAGQREWEQERRAVDSQITAALDDLAAALVTPTARNVDKATYIAGCLREMVTAKLRNRRQWSWYQPRIDEEFSGG